MQTFTQVVMTIMMTVVVVVVHLAAAGGQGVAFRWCVVVTLARRSC